MGLMPAWGLQAFSAQASTGLWSCSERYLFSTAEIVKVYTRVAISSFQLSFFNEGIKIICMLFSSWQNDEK